MASDYLHLLREMLANDTNAHVSLITRLDLHTGKSVKLDLEFKIHVLASDNPATVQQKHLCLPYSLKNKD